MFKKDLKYLPEILPAYVETSYENNNNIPRELWHKN